MPTAFVTYAGDPGKDPSREYYGDQGTAPWTVGEEREFTDAYAVSAGRPPNGYDYALLFTSVQNANLRKPRFTLREEPDPEPDPTPAPAAKRGKATATDSTQPADADQPAPQE